MKVNEVLVASKGPFLTGSSLFIFPLLPSSSTFLKCSTYTRALYTIKPSPTPPPWCLIWRRGSFVIRGGGVRKQRAQRGGGPRWARRLSMPFKENR